MGDSFSDVVCPQGHNLDDVVMSHISWVMNAQMRRKHGFFNKAGESVCWRPLTSPSIFAFTLQDDECLEQFCCWPECWHFTCYKMSQVSVSWVAITVYKLYRVLQFIQCDSQTEHCTETLFEDRCLMYPCTNGELPVIILKSLIRIACRFRSVNGSEWERGKWREKWSE